MTKKQGSASATPFGISFGSNQPSTPFGISFGATQPSTSAPFIFGATQPSTSSSSLFGATQPSTPSAPPFGANQPSTSSSLFGANQPTPSAPFFELNQPSTSTSSIFGANQPTPSAPPFELNQPTPSFDFGVTPPASSFDYGAIQPAFAPSFADVQPFSLGSKTDQRLKCNLPKNKTEALIFMTCLDQKNSIENTKKMIDNTFNESKISIENLWFTSLIDSKLIELKVDAKYKLFATLYSSFLKELMVESVQSAEDVYSWLLRFAHNHKDQKMLWLFTILKYVGNGDFPNVLDLSNELEVFVLALQTFLTFDNRPTQLVEKAIKSTNQLYKTFLLSMVGASYGSEYSRSLGSSNHKISDLIQMVK